MPRQATPLTDTKIKSLKARPARYRISDSAGLMLEVMPSGAKIWRYRYQLHGVRHPPLTIGNYPEIGLAHARKRRDEWAALVARGESPKRAVQAEKTAMLNTVGAFGKSWLDEQLVGKSPSYVTTMRRLMTKDVFPMLGDVPLSEVKPADIMALCDRIKARGAPKMALLTRNALRRMYDFAIARQLAESNPAAALVARFIATEESRTRVLSPQEIGVVLRAIHASDIRRSLKLALNLLFITMVRKAELTEATWDEFDLAAGVWDIPAERMKKDRPHRVYLSRQALAMLEELKGHAGKSAYVFPSTRGVDDRPISKSTLNQAVRALSIDVQHFVLHDFRRTASTHLHEMGHSSDAIERTLAHKIVGIKGVYNRAEYSEQRRVILQAWADFVQAQLDGGTVTPLFRAA
ncbi:tyrosine-type recombinase/integrase [Massilia sp. BSC265]|uniref:tyrosine-type recombinase/integrase n=1 Tax=Massilia sp. BSC265 TaxID=1549812 RepID=UPI0004E8E446|nr:tyrosine-type recombinase/integrase [Massilia sp. BSC265]KFI05458.1 integrase [Massilia sp. BSC265]